MNKVRQLAIGCLCFLLLLCESAAFSGLAKIKDITSIKGNRTNHIQGIGLVVGLAGTGDSPASLTTNQLVANLITRMGLETSPNGAITQNLAAVIVTATLPAFARNGDKLDLRLSVIGNATSLVGGTLIPTRLVAGDGLVYAVGSGEILTGQADGTGAKTLTVATIPNGGVVEREFTPDLVTKNEIVLSLKDPDFTTSSRIAEEINSHFKGYYAKSLDPNTVSIQLPRLYSGRTVDFVSELEGLKVNKDMTAIVVINERTGTIVMGAEVTIDPVVVSHGELTIEVKPPSTEENKDKDKKVDKKDIKKESLVGIKGATVGELVKSLNTMGIRPNDLVGIMQAIHASGALNAKLKLL